jgi:hypothetical protein
VNKTIKIDQIRTDGGTQTRHSMRGEIVTEYAEAYQAKVILPPLKVFYDGEYYWLADGFHRVGAARKAGLEELPCSVEKGGVRDAILFAVGCNADHGLRRTAKDKEAAVQILLEDSVWSTRSSNWIAEKCKVSWAFVDQLRPKASDAKKDANGKQGANGKQEETKAEDSGSHMRTSDGTEEDKPKEARRKGKDGKMYGAKGKKEEDKNGSEAGFDWRGFFLAFTPIAQVHNRIAKAHPGEKKSQEFKDVEESLESLAKALKAWQKRLAKE